MFGLSFHEKWGVPRSEGANFLIQATEKLIWKDGKDWDDVEFIAKKIMNDMRLSGRNQKKSLRTIWAGWKRHHDMVRAGLVEADGSYSTLRTQDIAKEMDGFWNDPACVANGVPLGRIADIRRKLTALITWELYSGGDKAEGRKALMMRTELDKFLFNFAPTGDSGPITYTRRAIVAEHLAEQLEFLEYADAMGGSRKGIKVEMLKLMEDPDRFERFNDEDKAVIRQIAYGSWLFAKARLDRLRKTVGGRQINPQYDCKDVPDARSSLFAQ
jgi:hypothetical protein